MSDWQLIEQCLKGDSRAWRLLHDRHQKTLRCIIRNNLGDDRYDRHLMEDLAQSVWLTLLRKDYDVLRRYEHERSSLITYLRDVSKQAIKIHYRVKRRRVQAAALGDQEPIDRRAESGLVRAQFREYENSLSPQESRYLHQTMIHEDPEMTQPPLSAANQRWLRYRMKRKWRHHFDTT